MLSKTQAGKGVRCGDTTTMYGTGVHVLKPYKAPSCVTVMFRVQVTNGVVLLPELPDAVFAVGSTKTVSGISNEQRDMWRTRRSKLLSSMLGANNAFPTTIRLSQLETLRTTKDPIQLHQIESFCRRIGENPPYEVRQQVGDCAETVPLAVMANMPGGGTIATITVLTRVVKDIRPLLNFRELKTRIVAHPPCLNCMFAFARAEVNGTMVLEVGDIEPCVHGYSSSTVNVFGPFGELVKGPANSEQASSSSDLVEPAIKRTCTIKPDDECPVHCVSYISSSTADDVYPPFGLSLQAPTTGEEASSSRDLVDPTTKPASMLRRGGFSRGSGGRVMYFEQRIRAE